MTLSIRAEDSEAAPSPGGRRGLILLERTVRSRLQDAAKHLSLLRGAAVEGPDTEVTITGLAQVLREQNRPCLAVDFEVEAPLRRVILLVRQRDVRGLIGLPPAAEGQPLSGEAELEASMAERALRTLVTSLVGAEPDPGRVEAGHLALLSSLDARQVLAVTGTYRVHQAGRNNSLGVRDLPVTILLDARHGGDWLALESAPVPACRVAFPAAPITSARSAAPRLWERIPLPVKAVAGRCRLPLERISRMGAGSLLSFDIGVDGPVDLEVEGRVVARGQLVVSGGRYAVLVTEILEALS